MFGTQRIALRAMGRFQTLRPDIIGAGCITSGGPSFYWPYDIRRRPSQNDTLGVAPLHLSISFTPDMSEARRISLRAMGHFSDITVGYQSGGAYNAGRPFVLLAIWRQASPIGKCDIGHRAVSAI